jgi:hypothetical protein
MIPTPTEKALLNEYREERRKLLSRLKHIETYMAQFTSQNGADELKGSNAEVEDMPRTIRHAVRAYLKEVATPKAAPEIARAMWERGFFPTYKQTKSNVDSTLARMVGKELQKSEAGYQVKKTDDSAVSVAA